MPRVFGCVPLFLLAFSMACTSTTPPASEPEPELAPLPSAPPASSTTPSSDPEVQEPEPVPPGSRIRTLFVHEQQVDCEGEQPMKCLQVRESDDEEWTYFYSRIEGFEHEESYRYELRVLVEEVSRPPMDATTERYRLVEVVSKKRVETGD